MLLARYTNWNRPCSALWRRLRLQRVKMRNDAIDVKVNEGLLAFGTKEEGAVAVIVDEEIYTRTAGGQGVAEIDDISRTIVCHRLFLLVLYPISVEPDLRFPGKANPIEALREHRSVSTNSDVTSFLSWNHRILMNRNFQQVLKKRSRLRPPNEV